ncbi:MAG: FHA domain-containing protein [Dactylosporangium sp.]|nr:FHA domain-containing protein [Dactylosporangium sp.]NNJ60885.1 FHA domain-containing protein [Dactylosporangium sp.]
MRFTLSSALDMIERRLTTDAMLAQGVVDLGEVVRYVDIDGGRSTSLLRIGMVVDALGRYLVDAGAVLYPVAGRALLSEAAFTSKERMVLGRWADDGIIEIVPDVADRTVEVADLTGLPVITVRDLDRYASRYAWLRECPDRVLRLRPRGGEAVLLPNDEDIAPVTVPVVVGKAAVKPEPVAPEPAVPAEAAEGTEAAEAAEAPEGTEAAEAPEPAAESVEGTEDAAEAAESLEDPEAPETPEPAADSAEATAEPSAPQLPGAIVTFFPRGAMRVSTTQIGRQRPVRSGPSGVGQSLLRNLWRCAEPDCSAFGEYRMIGQPVPAMASGIPSCPRHGGPLREAGRRPPAYAMALVVDDLPRRRFVVAEGEPVTVGRVPPGDNDIGLSGWLHEAAAQWVSAEHLRLNVRDGALIVVDDSRNGTMIWKRSSRGDPGRAFRITHDEHPMGAWDSIEVYTGVELIVAGRRGTAVTGVLKPELFRDLRSVLVDAPTVALRRPETSR